MANLVSLIKNKFLGYKSGLDNQRKWEKQKEEVKLEYLPLFGKLSSLIYHRKSPVNIAKETTIEKILSVIHGISSNDDFVYILKEEISLVNEKISLPSGWHFDITGMSKEYDDDNLVKLIMNGYGEQIERVVDIFNEVLLKNGHSKFSFDFNENGYEVNYVLAMNSSKVVFNYMLRFGSENKEIFSFEVPKGNNDFDFLPKFFGDHKFEKITDIILEDREKNYKAFYNAFQFTRDFKDKKVAISISNALNIMKIHWYHSITRNFTKKDAEKIYGDYLSSLGIEGKLMVEESRYEFNENSVIDYSFVKYNITSQGKLWDVKGREVIYSFEASPKLLVSKNLPYLPLEGTIKFSLKYDGEIPEQYADEPGKVINLSIPISDYTPEKAASIRMKFEELITHLDNYNSLLKLEKMRREKNENHS